MQQLPSWARTLLIIGIVVLLLLPFAFLAIRYFAIPARVSSLIRTTTHTYDIDQAKRIYAKLHDFLPLVEQLVKRGKTA